MSTDRALVVWAHPRTDSLTATIAADVITELMSAGMEVDVLDLHREGFDPVLREPDEPDWDDVDHAYSDEVMRLAARTKTADAVVFVFPVWWYSIPAILKGYIDRVWNHGLFCGAGRRSGLAAARWIGLAGESEASYRKRRYDELMAHHLDVGIGGLTGVADSRVHLLYDALSEETEDAAANVRALRAQARAAAAELAESLRDRERPASPQLSDVPA